MEVEVRRLSGAERVPLHLPVGAKNVRVDEVELHDTGMGVYNSLVSSGIVFSIFLGYKYHYLSNFCGCWRKVERMAGTGTVLVVPYLLVEVLVILYY